MVGLKIFSERKGQLINKKTSKLKKIKINLKKVSFNCIKPTDCLEFIKSHEYLTSKILFITFFMRACHDKLYDTVPFFFFN